MIRRSSSFNTGRIKHLFEKPALHQGGGEILCLSTKGYCSSVVEKSISKVTSVSLRLNDNKR